MDAGVPKEVGLMERKPYVKKAPRISQGGASDSSQRRRLPGTSECDPRRWGPQSIARRQKGESEVTQGKGQSQITMNAVLVLAALAIVVCVVGGIVALFRDVPSALAP